MESGSAFFYGTLMVPTILFRVIYNTIDINKHPDKKTLANTLTFTKAVVPDHARLYVKGEDYPGMIPQKGQSVHGIYVTGLTKIDIKNLDQFEGSQYTRKLTKVILTGGKAVEAETYIFTSGAEYLSDKEWDLEDFKANRMHRWGAGSSEYDDIIWSGSSEEDYHQMGVDTKEPLEEKEDRVGEGQTLDAADTKGKIAKDILEAAV